MENGDFIAFADDLLIMEDSKDSAVTTIQELEKLKAHGLTINKAKTALMTDRKELVKTRDGV